MLTPESGLGPASFFRFWKTSILKRVPKKFSTCLWVATNSWVSPFKGEVGSKSDEVFNLPRRSSIKRFRIFLDFVTSRVVFGQVCWTGGFCFKIKFWIEMMFLISFTSSLFTVAMVSLKKLEIRSIFLNFVVYAINWINSLNANNHHQFIIKVLILVIIIIVLRNKIPETRPDHHLLGSPKLSSQWSLSFSTCRAMRPV